MPRKILCPEQLDFQPRPTYPYSPGTRGGNKVFTAGQVAWGSDGNIVGSGDIEAQTRQTLSNVEAVLHEGGASWDDVLKCNVYLKNMDDFQRELSRQTTRAHNGADADGRGNDARRDRGGCLYR
jgi:2-iminobutanoate/2-iminopropanoate deaminase